MEQNIGWQNYNVYDNNFQESRLRDIFDNFEQAIGLLDCNFTIQFLNKRAIDFTKDVLGLNLEQGTSIWDISKPESKEKINSILSMAFKGETVRIEEKLMSYSSEVLWLSFILSPVRNQFSNIDSLIIIAQELTPQKMSEGEIFKKEERLKEIVDCQSELICRFRADGQIVFVNKPYCLFFGKSEKELLGLNYYLLIPEWLREKAKEDFISLSVSNPSKSYTFPVLGADEEVYWFSGTTTAIFNRGGTITEFQLLGRDITDLKRIEIDLTNSRDTYNTLLKNTADCILVFDKKGEVLQSHSQSTDFDKDQINSFIGKCIDEIFPAKISNSIKEVLNKCLTDDEIHTINIDLKISGEDRNFITKWLRLGRHEIISAFREIPNQRKLQDIILANEKLEASEKINKSFINNISRELRAPLSSILGFLELLRSTSDLDPKQSRYIEAIKACGFQLVGIMNNILEIPMIEKERIELVSSDCYLPDVINDLYAYYVIQMDELCKNKVKLIKTTQLLHPKKMRIDGTWLYQIFINLINNAIKYTYKGYIEFGYIWKENDVVRFFVKDTGIGIPREKLKLIFEPYRQVDESFTRIHGESGIGLAISRMLVERMGGKLLAESNPGVGSMFYFEIKTKKSSQHHNDRKNPI